MTTYLVRRLLLGLVTLLVVTMLVYGLIRNMPGTPLTIAGENMDPSKKISEADYKLMENAYGLDLPWYQAYFVWLGNVVRGDLSTSFRERRPVTAVISQRIGPTLLLGGLALLIQYVLSVPLGLYSTVRSGKWDERTVNVLLYVLYSLPTYVAALSLLLVFYLYLKDTPWQLKPGMVSDNYADLSPLGKAADIGKHLLLPLVCFSYGGLAYFSRFVKANMEEAIRQDYIRTARAKGVGPLGVLVNHAFRNTLIPLVTLLGLTLPGILSGSIILEQIFSWPGMGMLFFEALSVRDYPVIMGLTFLFSVMTLAGQLLADLLYAVVDPRVTYGKQ
jgi:peptide/nickel transport system permease protein